MSVAARVHVLPGHGCARAAHARDVSHRRVARRQTVRVAAVPRGLHGGARASRGLLPAAAPCPLQDVAQRLAQEEATGKV